MPRYYGSGGPADWAQFQQGRRDDQLRDILNTMMALKQYSDESGWKQKAFDYNAQQDELQNARAEALNQAQVANYAEVPAPKPAPEDQLAFDLKKLEAEESIKSKYRDKGDGAKSGQDTAATAYINGIAKRYDDAIGDLSDPVKSMGIDNAPTWAANLAVGRSELSKIQKKLARKVALTEDDWLMLDRLDSGMGAVRERGAWWAKAPSPRAMPTPRPGAAPAPQVPPTSVIKRVAQKGNVRVDVFSTDGGKTWLDAQGNVIPIGK